MVPMVRSVQSTYWWQTLKSHSAAALSWHCCQRPPTTNPRNLPPLLHPPPCTLAPTQRRRCCTKKIVVVVVVVLLFFFAFTQCSGCTRSKKIILVDDGGGSVLVELVFFILFVFFFVFLFLLLFLPVFLVLFLLFLFVAAIAVVLPSFFQKSHFNETFVFVQRAPVWIGHVHVQIGKPMDSSIFVATAVFVFEGIHFIGVKRRLRRGFNTDAVGLKGRLAHVADKHFVQRDDVHVTQG